MIRAFASLGYLGLYRPALLRRVFVVGGRQFGNEGDDTPTDPHLQLAAGFDADLAPNAGREELSGLFIHSDGHWNGA